MKKKKYIKNIIIAITIAILFLLIIQPTTTAIFRADDYMLTASEGDIVSTQFGGITQMLMNIGNSVALITLLLIGIKFMVGSLEERAEYKQRMIPYVIGSIFVFSIFNVVTIIQNFVGNTITGDIPSMGTKIVGIIDPIAKLIAIGTLILLGIKYMSGGVEDKSEIKASMMPYVIGAIIVYSTSNILSMVKTHGGQLVSSGTVEGIAPQLLDIIQTVGPIVALLVLAILGIKYMMGSAEEKAQFKSSMSPYVIGAALVFQASILAPMIGGIVSSATIDGIIYNIYEKISIIGESIAAIMLTVLGIKYMMGSTEERAQYKKSLMPYIVGAVIVFATSSVLNLIQNMAAEAVGAGDIGAIGNKIGEIVGVIGSLLSVILLVALGIKYMFSGTEEKAEYKKSFFPYLIGAIVVFGTTGLVRIVKEFSGITSSENIETIGQQFITVISVIGSLASVAILVTIGIRMMMSGTSERAEYKKSLTPYIIGASIVFAASQIAGIIYQFAIQI